MSKERNKRVEIGLPAELLGYAKLMAKKGGIKLDGLIQKSLEQTLLGYPLVPYRASNEVSIVAAPYPSEPDDGTLVREKSDEDEIDWSKMIK